MKLVKMTFAKKVLLTIASVVTLPLQSVLAQTTTPATTASDVGTPVATVLGTTVTVTPTVTAATQGNSNLILWIIAILVIAAIVGVVLYFLFGRNKEQ